MLHCSFAVNNLCLVSWKTLAKSELPMKCMEVWSKCQLSESILFHCTKPNFMDMQKPCPRRRSSSINPGPREAAECKPQGSPGEMLVLGTDWCIISTVGCYYDWIKKCLDTSTYHLMNHASLSLEILITKVIRYRSLFWE